MRGISPLRRRGGGRSPSGSFPIAPAAPSGLHLLTGIILGEGCILSQPSADSALCGGDQRTEPVWRLCNRPLETFAHPFPVTVHDPTLAGRGGSVSRRDHNQLAGNRAHLAWAHKSEEKPSLFPATLRERGSGGEALLLEKRPLPQKLPFTSSHHVGGVDFEPCVGVFAGGAGEGGNGG